eukprot:XP_011660400.1 PREDICTED: sushi, nidogen and EGF-like domain-containing protein 1 [Strongylocentrotus purpuratus]
MVVSWIDVLRGPDQNSTFQVLIGTDGELTYVIYNYKRVGWNAHRVGMYYPDGTLRHLELTLDDLVTGSNYGVQGSWLFEVSDTFREIGKVLCEPTNPCLNEGTCENDTCVCPEGFSGNFCHLV